MAWQRFFGGGDGLGRVEERLLDMLVTNRRTFDLAVMTLFGERDPEVVRQEVSDSDHEVNVGVREVRRQLVVHAATHGERADITALLLYMSVVKDIERIGDYAKNILDIARAGGDFTGAEDAGELADLRDRVSALITEARDVFAAQDTDRANRLLTDWDPVLAGLDDRVAELVTSEGPGYREVPRALYYRHLKRVGAHLMNILTALVMPLDELDFFARDDRPSP